MDKQIEFYTDIIESLGLKRTAADVVTDRFDQPIILKGGRRLVIPSAKILAQYDPDKYIAFHPMSENTLRGESDIIRMLCDLVANRVHEVVDCIMTTMVELAANKKAQSGMSPDEQAYFTALPEASANTVKKIKAIMDVASVKGEHRLISLFLKRDGSWAEDKKFVRLCVVRFPIMDEADNGDKSIFGVGMTLGDKKAILNLFKYIFPECQDEFNSYSVGSNDQLVPYFHALMGTYVQLASALNAVTEPLKGRIEGYEHFHINTKFAVHLPNLAKFHDLIPVLEGNDGDLNRTSETPAAPATTTAAYTTYEPAQTTASPLPPIITKAPPAQSNAAGGDKMDWMTALGMGAPAQQPPAVAQGYYAQPQPQPMYYAPQPPPPPTHPYGANAYVSGASGHYVDPNAHYTYAQPAPLVGAAGAREAFRNQQSYPAPHQPTARGRYL